MADFYNGYEVLKKREFSKPSNALHFNKGELGYTFMGVYQDAHPNWNGWKTIYQALQKENYSIKFASIELYGDQDLQKKVQAFYLRNFWNRMQLNHIHSQKIANEIFVFGVNTNPSLAIKKAQRIARVKEDGFIGAITIRALNNTDDRIFDREYDKLEIKYYKYLAWLKPEKFVRFLPGWINRARAI